MGRTASKPTRQYQNQSKNMKQSKHEHEKIIPSIDLTEIDRNVGPNSFSQNALGEMQLSMKSL
jgi:hypothetical protein